MRIFPIDSYYKNRSLLYAKVGDFYNGGLWAKALSFVRSCRNFVSGYVKNVDTHHESFSSKKESNKKVIAKNPLTNLYEMNSRSGMRHRVLFGDSSGSKPCDSGHHGWCKCTAPSKSSGPKLK